MLTHSSLFAHLTAWGEAITGVGLTLGLLTGVASLVGLLLVINYGLATQWMSPGQQGFHSCCSTSDDRLLLRPRRADLGARRLALRRPGPSRRSPGGRSPERPVSGSADDAGPASGCRPTTPSASQCASRRAVDHAEDPVRVPALVPLPHHPAVLGGEAWWTGGVGVHAPRGCGPSRTTRAGRSARSTRSDEMLIESASWGVRAARMRSTKTVSLRIEARQAGDPLLLGGHALLPERPEAAGRPPG